MWFKQVVVWLGLLGLTQAYLNVNLEVTRKGQKVGYMVPIRINGLQYQIPITLEDEVQFVKSIAEKGGKKKKHRPGNLKQKMAGTLEATSLQGYSFEGWKRFFMEALLYIEQRYYHQVQLNLTFLEVRQSTGSQSIEDGLISLGPLIGPDPSQLLIFKQIRRNSEYVQDDVISIYRGINDKGVQMQLGGYEENFAKGHSNGVLFYETGLESKDGEWRIPFKSIYCTREKRGRDDLFYIASSAVSLKISIRSQLVVLPQRLAGEVQRNFEAPDTTCKISEQSRLVCYNMTSVDLALNYLNLKIDEGAFINISLYDLRDTYDEKDKSTTFFLSFTNHDQECQIGEVLFKSNYVSIDFRNHNLLFSPLNRYPAESYGVYFVRLAVGFCFFMLFSAVGVMIWQAFNDPFQKNRVDFNSEGFRLVSYRRPGEYDERVD